MNPESLFTFSSLDLTALVTMLLISVTLVLSVALALSWLMARSAASRYAILFWALVTVGASPLIVVASRLPVAREILPAPVVARAAAYRQAGDRWLTASPTLDRDATGTPAIMPWLAGAWAAGAMLGFVRIMHGVLLAARMARRARRDARPLDPRLHARLARELAAGVPPILVTGEAAVPLVVGWLRPVVVLPARLVESWDDDCLLAVLLHECAHAARRDPLVGLYQRVLAALLWFHPLVHVVNRWLDRACEELCDNYALRVVAPGDYARTLLAVATSLPRTRIPLFGVGFYTSPGRLETRVAGLLSAERNTMTRLSIRKSAVVALLLAGSCFTVATLAAPNTEPRSGYDLDHKVDFQVGAAYLRDGDVITVDEVRGTASTFLPGNVYVVKGTYKLASRDSATLSVYVTVDAKAHRSVPSQNTQSMRVEKGEGKYSLIYYMWQDGKPHLSYYPAEGGSSFASLYFGIGDTLLTRGYWE